MVGIRWLLVPFRYSKNRNRIPSITGCSDRFATVWNRCQEFRVRYDERFGSVKPRNSRRLSKTKTKTMNMTLWTLRPVSRLTKPYDADAIQEACEKDGVEVVGEWRNCQKLAEMLLKHLEGILNYCRTKVRFGVVEAVNSNLRLLINRGRGYKNLRYLLLKAKRMAVTNTELLVFRTVGKAA